VSHSCRKVRVVTRRRGWREPKEMREPQLAVTMLVLPGSFVEYGSPGARHLR
jgi:hypothetical protein